MKNINTIIFNSDLTVREQTESPIQAFSSYQNIIRAVIPYDTSYIPFGVFHATNDASDVATPTQLILLLPNGTSTVDGETYYVYEQKVPEAVVASLRATKVEFVLSLWASKNNFIGVQRYDETASGYNTTTYIAAQLLQDFPQASADEYVRVFNTETDWQFDGSTWSDTNDTFETVLEDSRSEIVEFALYRGKSTGKPTHKPSNTEAIIESLNLKVNKSGDVMTGALQFANAGLTRLILGTNKISTEDGINATTFDNGDEVSDAIKYSDLATLFDVTAVDPENTANANDNWLNTYATAIENKFAEYSKLADLGVDFLLTNGNSTMTGNIDAGGNDLTNVNLVDGVDVSQLKTDYDNHTHTEADITDLDKYTQTEVDNLVTPKVDKTTTIAGVDLQDNISVAELKTAIGNATEALDGLLSKEDKATINTLTELLLDNDENNVTDTIQEILNIFSTYPEGVDIAQALAGKVDTSVIGNRTYTENNHVTNEESVTASIDALDQAVNDKADVGHTHTESDITDLDKYTQQQVDDNFAPISHTHTKADITDFAHTHLEADITDLDKYTQTEVNDLLDAKADDADLTTHINDTTNPHNVTANQTGAEPAFSKNTAFNKNFGTTAGTVAEGSHVTDTTNPHAVTAAQVGAYTTGEADTNFAAASHDHTEADITDLDKYTQTQVDNLLTAKADLVAGKVPASQLPSYVDDVIEGYYNTADGKFYTESEFTNEITGETGKIYVDLVSGAEIYRWSGSAFTQIIEAVAFGTIAGTAYEGNAGQANADAIADIEDGTTTVTKAQQDQNGNVIDTTYATKTELTNATDELNDIGDVTITSAQNGNFLKWDGSQWVNAPISGLTTISSTPPTGASTGDLWFDNDNLIMYILYDDGDSTQWVNTQGGVLEDRVEVLTDLQDVNTPSPTDGQVLAFNDTSGEWEATTLPAETGLANVEYFTTTISTGDWSGTDPTTSVKTIAGILSTDKPLIDIDLSSVAFANVETTQTEYAKLYRVAATADNQITFYALEAPTENFTIQIKVVR